MFELEESIQRRYYSSLARNVQDIFAVSGVAMGEGGSGLWPLPLAGNIGNTRTHVFNSKTIDKLFAIDYE